MISVGCRHDDNLVRTAINSVDEKLCFQIKNIF